MHHTEILLDFFYEHTFFICSKTRFLQNILGILFIIRLQGHTNKIRIIDLEVAMDAGDEFQIILCNFF